MKYDEFYAMCLDELNGTSSAQVQLNPACASVEVMNGLERYDATSHQQAPSARRGASILQAHEDNSWADVTDEFERCNAMSLQQARSARNAAVILLKQQQNVWDGVTSELERCNAMSPEQSRSARNAAVILQEQQQNVWDAVTNELERCNAMSPQQARSARQAAAAMQHECNDGDLNHPVGVGIVLLQHDEDAARSAGRADTKRGHHVVAVAPDSPAGKSKHVFPGDMLVEIDGTDVRGYDAAALRPYILGVPGSQVVLGFRPLY
jgi:C-terminal processing protease CtpA/Prc